MKKHRTRVLLLNMDYQPISTISWKKALIFMFMNQEDYVKGAEVIEWAGKDDFVTSAGGQVFQIPSIMRMTRYIKLRKRDVPFSRKNVFLRDKLTCGYCYKKFDVTELTYDHVVPRIKWPKGLGTPTKWENIITCCRPCNRRKAGRTPKEANMHIAYTPYKPTFINYIMGLSPWSKDIPEEWRKYLPDYYN